MKLTCNKDKLVEAIINPQQKETFLNKYGKSDFAWGMEIQTCERWSTKMQGKVWRDIGIAAKLLETKRDVIYSILKTAKPTRHLFEKTEWVGAKGRGKEVISEKGLSHWTKEDCSDGFELITDYLQMIINSVYQEVVKVNWSAEENIDLPDYEFTGQPVCIE